MLKAQFQRELSIVADLTGHEAALRFCDYMPMLFGSTHVLDSVSILQLTISLAALNGEPFFEAMVRPTLSQVLHAVLYKVATRCDLITGQRWCEIAGRGAQV